MSMKLVQGRRTPGSRDHVQKNSARRGRRPLDQTHARTWDIGPPV